RSDEDLIDDVEHHPAWGHVERGVIDAVAVALNDAQVGQCVVTGAGERGQAEQERIGTGGAAEGGVDRSGTRQAWAGELTGDGEVATEEADGVGGGEILRAGVDRHADAAGDVLRERLRGVGRGGQAANREIQLANLAKRHLLRVERGTYRQNRQQNRKKARAAPGRKGSMRHAKWSVRQPKTKREERPPET